MGRSKNSDIREYQEGISRTRVLYAWQIYTLISLVIFAGIVFSYYYVDRLVVRVLHDQNSRQYRILHYIQKFPEGFTLLLPFTLLWSTYRWYIRKSSYAEQCLFLSSWSLLIVGLLKFPLKFFFGRYWPASVSGEMTSFITDGMYGFNFFHWGMEYQSFPSTHAAVTFAVVPILWRFYPQYKWLVSILCVLLITGVIGCYYHFVSDVLAGAFIGLLTGIAILSCREKLIPYRQ